MAKLTLNVFLFLLLSLVAIAFLTHSQADAAIGGKVGGRTEIKDVKTNKEVQDLGRYCVAQYNEGLKGKKQGTKLLSFTEVVKAEKQVVTGIKYFLRISASMSGGGGANTFDAVVVVKAWANSKELLSFSPSTPA